MGAKKLDGEPNTPTFVKLVQNDQNGVAVGWEVEPSSQYAILFSAPGGGGGGGVFFCVFLGRGVVLSSHSLVLFEFLTLEQTTLSNLHTHKRYGVDRTIVEYGVEVLEDEGSTAAAAVAAATISSNGDGTLVRHLMLEAVAMWTFARSSSYREPSKTCSTPHN